MQVTECTGIQDRGENLEFHELIVQQKRTDMGFCEFLKYINFDTTRFALPLEFWFELNNRKEDEWFLLTDEMISLIGFKSSESNPSVGRSNLLKFLRKNFNEGVHFLLDMVGLAKNSRGGAHHMFEIRMQKRPFKKLLLKVGTSTSDLIHDYILDLEQGAMKYIVYQNECRVHLLRNENSNLKKDRSPVTLRIEPDYSKMPTLARERDDYIMSIKIDAHLHKVFGHEKKKRRRHSSSESESDSDY